MPLAPQVEGRAGAEGQAPLVSRTLGLVAHLKVPVHHPHLVAMQHGLQDLLDAVTGERKEMVTV